MESLADLLLNGISLLLGTGYVASVDTLRRAAQLLQDGPISAEDTIRWIQYGTVITDELWDDRTYIAWIERVESVARKRGALIALKVSLITLAVHQIRIGKFSAAEAYYAESLEISAATGGVASVAVDLYRPLNVELLAWRGDDAGTRAAAKTLIEMGEAVGGAVLQFHGLPRARDPRAWCGEILRGVAGC